MTTDDVVQNRDSKNQKIRHLYTTTDNKWPQKRKRRQGRETHRKDTGQFWPGIRTASVAPATPLPAAADTRNALAQAAQFTVRVAPYGDNAALASLCSFPGLRYAVSRISTFRRRMFYCLVLLRSVVRRVLFVTHERVSRRGRNSPTHPLHLVSFVVATCTRTAGIPR